MAKSALVLAGLICTGLLASGCALQSSAPPEERSPADPWEPLNRQIQGFNHRFDRWTLRPIAKAYELVIPDIIRLGISNFSNYLFTPRNIINNCLQGKGRDCLSETGRLVVNTTFGLLGILDVAADMGLEQKDEDFGQTFAVWGVPAGPFVSVPILGPRTLRDALSIPLNFLADPLWHYDNASVRDKIYFVRLIEFRARLLPFDDLLRESPDVYVTVRESYLQRRNYLIHDGNPPEDDDFYEDFEDDFDDDPGN